MDTTILDAIIKDSIPQSGEVPVGCSVDGRKTTKSTVKVQVTTSIIDDVCNKLAEDDKSVSGRKRDFFSNVERNEIFQVTGFLNKCLGRRSKFISSCREKAWGNYHREYLNNMEFVISVTKSPGLAVILCLAIFERLLDLKFPFPEGKKIEERSKQLNDRDVDVINYVGGSVIRALRGKLYRRKSSSSIQLQFQLLSKMCSTSSAECEDSSLTCIFNRGGLTKLSRSSKDFFQMLEVKFRDVAMTPEQSKCTHIDFQEMCSTDTEVTFKFEQTLNSLTEEQEEEVAHIVDTRFEHYDGELDEENADTVKMQVFRDIVAHFFKVRIHHECKLFMDRYRCREAVDKAQKGLRKTLKGKVSNK